MTVTYEVGGSTAGGQLDIDFYVCHVSLLSFLASRLPDIVSVTYLGPKSNIPLKKENIPFLPLIALYTISTALTRRPSAI